MYTACRLKMLPTNTLEVLLPRVGSQNTTSQSDDSLESHGTWSVAMLIAMGFITAKACEAKSAEVNKVRGSKSRGKQMQTSPSPLTVSYTAHM